MVTQGPIIKPGKAPNAKVDAGADRNGPQHAMSAELEFALATLGKESLNVPLTYACKEEYGIKIALAGQLRFSLWQVGILGQFAGREGAQIHNRHAGVFGKGFQGVGGCRHRYCDRDAGETTETQGCRRPRARNSGFRS